MENKVYLSPCTSYDVEEIKKAYEEIIINNNLLDFVKPGMTIGIKANLVSAMKPEEAATTHPMVIKVLCDYIIERGAKVIIGDSPGGLYTETALKSVYKASGMNELVCENVSLNNNFNGEVREVNGDIVHQLDCTSWLFECDALINVCKLKSHGMMGMSCAVKNLFGTVPGILKPEYHYRYPDHNAFAGMLIDINEYYKFNLNIVDAIVGMEGNGPTQGTPRNIGLLMASTNPYALDVVCCNVIGLDVNEIGTVRVSIKRGLTSGKLDELDLNIPLDKFIIKDYNNIKPGKDMEFESTKKGFSKFIYKIAKKFLIVKPVVNKKECIGCKKCANICPAKAITMKNKIPSIDRNKCIRCFCCQEFCPKGAMKAKKNAVVQLLNNTK